MVSSALCLWVQRPLILQNTGHCLGSQGSGVDLNVMIRAKTYFQVGSEALGVRLSTDCSGGTVQPMTRTEGNGSLSHRSPAELTGTGLCDSIPGCLSPSHSVPSAPVPVVTPVGSLYPPPALRVWAVLCGRGGPSAICLYSRFPGESGL